MWRSSLKSPRVRRSNAAATIASASASLTGAVFAAAFATSGDSQSLSFVFALPRTNAAAVRRGHFTW